MRITWSRRRTPFASRWRGNSSSRGHPGRLRWAAPTMHSGHGRQACSADGSATSRWWWESRPSPAFCFRSPGSLPIPGFVISAFRLPQPGSRSRSQGGRLPTQHRSSARADTGLPRVFFAKYDASSKLPRAPDSVLSHIHTGRPVAQICGDLLSVASRTVDTRLDYHPGHSCYLHLLLRLTPRHCIAAGLGTSCLSQEGGQPMLW
jgi:hypothetical protein